MRNIHLPLTFLLFILLCGNGLLAQQPSARVTGTIKTSDGKPATGVAVVLKHTQQAVKTDLEGKFTFANVPFGNYILKVSALGLKPLEQAITVNAASIADLEFYLVESTTQLNEVKVEEYKASNTKTVKLGKVAIPAKDLPQSVQVIGTQLIADQQANDLGDVMKNVNGVALGANRGSVGENFFARGYSLGANNVLKNGARTTIGGRPEASTLESVEVLKGSAALLYGGVTGGAVVNMVTKKPKFEYGGEVAMRAGSYDLYKPIADVYGPISKNLAFRAIGTYEKAGSFRDNVHAERLYVNPSLLYQFSKNTELLVQADYLKSDYTPDFGIGSVNNKIVDLGRNRFLNAPWAYNKTNTATAQVNFVHQLNDNWKVNLIGSFQSYNRDYFGAERIQANASGVAARNLSKSKLKEATYNQQLNINGKLQTGKISHVLVVGADADQARNTSNGFNYGIDASGKAITTFNYGNVNVFDATTYYGSGIVPEVYAVSRTLTPVYRYGIFVQDLVSLTSQLKALAGVRYTFQKNAAVKTTTFQTGNVAVGTKKTDQAWSPKFGLVYEPFKTTSLYVSYANNFIVNTGLDIFGAALPPSNVNQYEAGIKNDFLNGRLTANVTYYKIINGNIAQTAELRADGTPNADTNVKQLNGETTSDGLEVDLSGTLLPGLNFVAGFAYNYMRYTNTAPVATYVVPSPTPSDPNATKTVTTAGMIEDVRLVGTTKYTANATLFYTIQNGRAKGLKLGISSFYTGKRNGGWNDNKAATTLRLMPLSAFATVDVSAGYSWSRFSLLAKLSNITNELNYFVHENYSVNPIAPRQFATTLSYRF